MSHLPQQITRKNKEKYNMNTSKLALFAVMFTMASSAMAAAPVFYPSAPEQPRIQFLKAMNGGSFFQNGGAFGDRFPGYQAQAVADKDGIKKPYGVALANGKVYVCDAGAGVVKIFDLDKKFVSNLGDMKPGKLIKPMNIAVDADGTKYVADVAQGQIMVYDAANVFVKAIGDSKTVKPTDLVLSKGKLYVTDMLSGQVIALDPKTGSELFKVGTAGFNDSSLVRGTNITADQAGNLYVSDTLGGKINVFTETGKFVRTIGAMGDSLGQFARSKGVAVDHANRLYAVDGAFENVQIFNDKDQLLLPFGQVGNTAGGLNMPAKVVVDYNHNKYFKQFVAQGYDIDYVILVSNQFGDNRVNVYGFLKKL